MPGVGYHVSSLYCSPSLHFHAFLHYNPPIQELHKNLHQLPQGSTLLEKSETTT